MHSYPLSLELRRSDVHLSFTVKLSFTPVKLRVRKLFVRRGPAGLESTRRTACPAEKAACGGDNLSPPHAAFCPKVRKCSSTLSFLSVKNIGQDLQWRAA